MTPNQLVGVVVLVIIGAMMVAMLAMYATRALVQHASDESGYQHTSDSGPVDARDDALQVA